MKQNDPSNDKFYLLLSGQCSVVINFDIFDQVAPKQTQTNKQNQTPFKRGNIRQDSYVINKKDEDTQKLNNSSQSINRTSIFPQQEKQQNSQTYIRGKKNTTNKQQTSIFQQNNVNSQCQSPITVEQIKYQRLDSSKNIKNTKRWSKIEPQTKILQFSHYEDNDSNLQEICDKYGKIITILEKNQSFGEKALLAKHPKHAKRNATIIANCFTECIVITRKNFKSIQSNLSKDIQQKQDIIEQLCGPLIPCIKNFQPLQKNKLYNAFVKTQINKGCKLIDEGAIDDKIFIIARGSAKLQKKVKDQKNQFFSEYKVYDISQIEQPSLLGEELLIDGEIKPYEFSVTITSEQATIYSCQLNVLKEILPVNYTVNNNIYSSRLQLVQKQQQNSVKINQNLKIAKCGIYDKFSENVNNYYFEQKKDMFQNMTIPIINQKNKQTLPEVEKHLQSGQQLGPQKHFQFLQDIGLKIKHKYNNLKIEHNMMKSKIKQLIKKYKQMPGKKLPLDLAEQINYIKQGKKVTLKQMQQLFPNEEIFYDTNENEQKYEPKKSNLYKEQFIKSIVEPDNTQFEERQNEIYLKGRKQKIMQQFYNDNQTGVQFQNADNQQNAIISAVIQKEQKNKQKTKYKQINDIKERNLHQWRKLRSNYIQKKQKSNAKDAQQTGINYDLKQLYQSHIEYQNMNETMSPLNNSSLKIHQFYQNTTQQGDDHIEENKILQKSEFHKRSHSQNTEINKSQSSQTQKRPVTSQISLAQQQLKTPFKQQPNLKFNYFDFVNTPNNYYYNSQKQQYNKKTKQQQKNQQYQSFYSPQIKNNTQSYFFMNSSSQNQSQQKSIEKSNNLSQFNQEQNNHKEFTDNYQNSINKLQPTQNLYIKPNTCSLYNSRKNYQNQEQFQKSHYISKPKMQNLNIQVKNQSHFNNNIKYDQQSPINSNSNPYQYNLKQKQEFVHKQRLQTLQKVNSSQSKVGINKTNNHELKIVLTQN